MDDFKKIAQEITHNLLFLFVATILLSSFSVTAKANTLPSPDKALENISSNPAAVNYNPGTGDAQRYLEKILGIHNDHGFKFRGALVADTNNLFSGGIPHAEKNTSNSLFLLNMTLDTEKFNGWKGGLFGVEFLQFNGQNTNAQAGSVQSYNSLPAAPPFNRSELYQLWFRQELFNQKLIVRLGKTVPTLDFNNLVRPISLRKENLSIPAVTGLIYTPVFVNTTMLGVLPGYYNSAYGVTINFVPNNNWYLSYGAYDGNLARGENTGLHDLPKFNGSYFHIAETGAAWLLGKNSMPGTLAVGIWHQTGPITPSPGLYEDGSSGIYLFGSQRMWYRHPEKDNSGVSIFYQYGINQSCVLPFKQYVGSGLTAFGLIPHRFDDSMGVGVALSWLNQKSFHRRTELMFQTYYQAKVMKDVYLEPVISYIPTPGGGSNLQPAWAGTLRGIVLF